MNDLEVNLKSKNMSFEVSTSLYDMMYVVCPIFGHVNCIFDENSLYVTSDKNIKSKGILKLYSLNIFSKKTKIYLHDDIHVNVKASLTSGNLCLDNLVINDANINNLYGNVVVKECNVDSLKVNSKDSKIKILDVSGTDVDLYSEKGNIGINGILSTKISAITQKGNINLKLYSEDKRLIGTKEENKQKLLSLSAPNGKVTKCFYY